MNDIYGIVDINNVHHDVSKSIKATKRYATINGYNKISIRYNLGYNTSIIFEKRGNKWHTIS